MTINSKVTGLSSIFLMALALLIPGQLTAQDGSGRGSQQANYHLMQLSVQTDKVSLEEFDTRTREIRSCRDARDLAKTFGADIKRDRFVMSHQLPEELREELSNTPTGHATKVFSADPSVMRVIVICHRV